MDEISELLKTFQLAFQAKWDIYFIHFNNETITFSYLNDEEEESVIVEFLKYKADIVKENIEDHVSGMRAVLVMLGYVVHVEDERNKED